MKISRLWPLKSSNLQIFCWQRQPQFVRGLNKSIRHCRKIPWAISKFYSTRVNVELGPKIPKASPGTWCEEKLCNLSSKSSIENCAWSCGSCLGQRSSVGWSPADIRECGASGWWQGKGLSKEEGARQLIWWPEFLPITFANYLLPFVMYCNTNKPRSQNFMVFFYHHDVDTFHLLASFNH